MLGVRYEDTEKYCIFTYVLPLGITRMTSLDMYYFLFPLFVYTTIVYLIYTTSYLTWTIFAGTFRFIFGWCLEGSGNLFDLDM
jgi:hypothetical protein